MKVLITGFPGMGKSAIATELKRRGHAAYDPETIRGYGYVTDRITGKHLHPPAPVPAGWFDTVGAQTWDQLKMRHLLAQPEDQFICGFAHNIHEFYEFFDYIFILTLDDVELEQRLLERRGSRIGKDAVELADIMRLHHQYERSLLARGAIALNTQHGVPELVDTILRACEQTLTDKR